MLLYWLMVQSNMQVGTVKNSQQFVEKQFQSRQLAITLTNQHFTHVTNNVNNGSNYVKNVTIDVIDVTNDPRYLWGTSLPSSSSSQDFCGASLSASQISPRPQNPDSNWRTKTDQFFPKIVVHKHNKKSPNV